MITHYFAKIIQRRYLKKNLPNIIFRWLNTVQKNSERKKTDAHRKMIRVKSISWETKLISVLIFESHSVSCNKNKKSKSIFHLSSMPFQLIEHRNRKYLVQKCNLKRTNFIPWKRKQHNVLNSLKITYPSSPEDKFVHSPTKEKNQND